MSDPFLDKLADYRMPIQLVLDGAIVHNIEDHLTSFCLSGRPLFRETADAEIVLAGPWLVPPASDRATLERCVAAARGAGKGVFWLGECGPDGLYKHLRQLNAARMPDGRILYFRHYDSDVLAAIIPLLDAQQAANLFGPARVISLVGGSADCNSVERPDSLPGTQPGPIAFEEWQIEVLNRRQRVLWRQKIVSRLRQEFPNETSSLDDAEFLAKMREYQMESVRRGMGSQDAIYNWARLEIATNGEAGRNSILEKKISEVPEDIRSEVFVLATPGFASNLNPETSLKNVEFVRVRNG